MGTSLSVAIDLIHAILMAAWIAGLPLLFVRRWPRLARVFAIYAVAFVVISQGSQLLLGECFLTTLAREALDGTESVNPEWFTVRAARLVFGLTPSAKAISVTFDALVAVVALGLLVMGARERQSRAAT